MIEHPPYNGQLAIFNLILWLFFIIYYRREIYRQTRCENNYAFVCILVILFSTFGFSEADTYHYQGLYDEMIKFGESAHVEPFYYWLAQFLPHNYYIWRFIIWGIAAILMIATFKRLNINSSSVGIVFPLILLQQFTLTRGCLGIALFIFSLSFLFKPSKHKIISCIFAVLGCAISLFLHRSLPLFMFMALLALIPFNKTLILFSILLYPIIRVTIMSYVFNILDYGIFSEEVTDFAQHYLQGEQSTTNINGIIRRYFAYIPRFLLFFVLIKEYIFQKDKIDKFVKFLLQYSYILFYVALLFLGQATSNFIASRTIHMMCFPLSIVLAYYLTNNKRSNLLKVAMFFFICSDLFSLMYFIYKCW